MVTTRDGAAREAAPGAATPAKTQQSSVNGPAAQGRNSKHEHEYEFFGPHGPALLVLTLPSVVYSLYFYCNSEGCLQLYPEFKVPGFPKDAQLFTTEAMLVFLGWFFGLVALHLVLPGKRAQGVVLPNGKRLTYKFNGEHDGTDLAWGTTRRCAHASMRGVT